MSNITYINKSMSRQAFLKRRERARTEGFTFVLPVATLENDGEPVAVRMRRISMDEKAAVNGITQTVQDEVRRRTRELASWAAKQQKQNASIEQQFDEVQSSETLQNAINAVFWAAMIEPAVVETDADAAQNPDAWHVDDFALADRFAVFRAATDDSSTEAKSLKLFRPESTDDAADSGTVHDAPPAKRGTASA